MSESAHVGSPSLSEMLVASASTRNGWIRSPQEGADLCLFDWNIPADVDRVAETLSGLVKSGVFERQLDGYRLATVHALPVAPLGVAVRRTVSSGYADEMDADTADHVSDLRRALALEQARSRDLAEHLVDERKFSRGLATDIAAASREAQAAVRGLNSEVAELRSELSSQGERQLEQGRAIRQYARSVDRLRVGVRGIYAAGLWAAAAAGAYAAFGVTSRPGVLIALLAAPALAFLTGIGILTGRGRLRLLLGAISGIASVVPLAYALLDHFLK